MSGTSGPDRDPDAHIFDLAVDNLSVRERRQRLILPARNESQFFNASIAPVSINSMSSPSISGIEDREVPVRSRASPIEETSLDRSEVMEDTKLQGSDSSFPQQPPSLFAHASASSSSDPPIFTPSLTGTTEISQDQFFTEEITSEGLETRIPQGYDLFNLTPAEKRQVYQCPALNRIAHLQEVSLPHQFRTTLCRFYHPDKLNPLLGMDAATFEELCTMGRLHPRPRAYIDQDNELTWSFLVTIIRQGEFRPSFVEGANFFKRYDRSGDTEYTSTEDQFRVCLSRLRLRLAVFIRLFRIMSPHVGHITIACWVPLEEWKWYIERAISVMKHFAMENSNENLVWKVIFTNDPTP